MIPPEDQGLGTTARLRLAAEIIALYVRARWQLGKSDLPTTVAVLRDRHRPSIDAGVDRRALGLRLGQAAIRTLRPLPVDSRCLMRSLVLCGLLAHRGIDSTLVLAAKAGESFAAHAWIEYEGKPLLEPAAEPFKRLTEL